MHEVRFRGAFERSLDSKGRVPLPPRFRDGIFPPDVADPVGIVSRYDGCLAVWAEADFEAWATALEADLLADEEFDNGVVLDALRRLNHHAYDVRLDGQGRIALPDLLIRDLGLDGTVTIAGAGPRVEIWDPAASVDGADREEGDALERAIRRHGG